MCTKNGAHVFTAGRMTLPGVRKGGTMQQQEFIQAVRDVETTMYHVAMSILRNEADSADAVQEALLRLLKIRYPD